MSETQKKILFYTIGGSLWALAIGLVTSMSLLGLFHILLIFPLIYFLNKGNYKAYPVSAWALLVLAFILILSIVLNQDIAVKGLAPLSKIKYFLIGFFSLAPFAWYFRDEINQKKVSKLLYAFCIATTFATLVGIFSRYWEFNPITWREISPIRNAGLSGMVMNYAYNLAFFQVIITGLLIYRKRIVDYININFLLIIFIINLIGLYLTYTRGAWAAYLISVPFFLFKNNKMKFALVVILSIFAGGVFYKLAGEKVIRPNSEIERLSQWQAALMAFKERPILGYGYLNFEEQSQNIKLRYDLPVKDFRGHAHNNLLEILATAGVLGFFSFLTWIIFWFYEMHRRDDLIALMTLPFIITFFVGGLTQSTISLGVNLFFIMSAYSISQARAQLSK